MDAPDRKIMDSHIIESTPASDASSTLVKALEEIEEKKKYFELVEQENQ
jgi:hypothetical protein